MLEGLRTWIRRLGVKMGLITELKKIDDHKKIDINTEQYERIELNKSIYKNYVKAWHLVDYISSNGELKQRNMKTLGIGKLTASKVARLIFNEKCDIDVATEGIDNADNDPAKEFIDYTFKANKFYRDFQRHLEYCYALGGVALKVYEHNGLIKIAYAAADAFIPLSNDSENIDEALFITREKKEDKHYTLLEWHEWDEQHNYVVTNELYESDKNDVIGTKVKLSTLYPDLEEKAILQGLTQPLFVYIKPNTANNKDLTSPLGISIYENSYDTIQMLDYLYDFYHHEFKLGKRRISVNRGMLKPVIDEDGKSKPVFDSEETVFVPLGIEDKEGIQDLSVGLRVNEIIAAINNNLDILAAQMGLSAGTFTFDGLGIKTATQVVSENSETYQTKNSHEILVEEAIKALVKAIIELANAYGIYNGSSDVDVTVNFDDSIAEDRQENYNYYSRAVKDGLYPKVKAIMKIFKVTENEAKDLIEEINADRVELMQQDLEYSLDMAQVPPLNMEDDGATE